MYLSKSVLDLAQKMRYSIMEIEVASAVIGNSDNKVIEVIHCNSYNSFCITGSFVLFTIIVVTSFNLLNSRTYCTYVYHCTYIATVDSQ